MELGGFSRSLTEDRDAFVPVHAVVAPLRRRQLVAAHVEDQIVRREEGLRMLPIVCGPPAFFHAGLARVGPKDRIELFNPKNKSH